MSYPCVRLQFVRVYLQLRTVCITHCHYKTTSFFLLYIYIYIYIYIIIYNYILYAYIYIYIYIYVCVYKYIYIYIYMCVCVCVCIYKEGLSWWVPYDVCSGMHSLVSPEQHQDTKRGGGYTSLGDFRVKMVVFSKKRIIALTRRSI